MRALDDHGSVAVLPLGGFTALGSAGARLTTDPRHVHGGATICVERARRSTITALDTVTNCRIARRPKQRKPWP